MAFGDEHWNILLPSYLTDENKGRLQDALKQFHSSYTNEISYDNFYKNYGYEYLLQGDILLEIRTANWNQDTALYEKGYVDGLVLSNTCDISFENNRNVNPKQCLFAPVLKLDDYLNDLSVEGYTEQKVADFKKNVIAQVYTNLFYLPKVNQDDVERIALLDRMFWFPIDELKPILENVNEERIASLNQFGFYLLAFKLSYHFCRLPEQCDREA